MGELSRRVARAFDVADGLAGFLPPVTPDAAQEPITKMQLASFAFAVRQALIDLALAIEQRDESSNA
jgi:hypothetical protein